MKEINIRAKLDRSQLDRDLKNIEKESHKINLDIDSSRINETNNSLNNLNNEGKSSHSVFARLKNTINETFSGGKVAMTAYLTALASIRNAAKEAKKTIKELDSSVTDLSIAMGEGRNSAYKYLGNLNKQAKELSATTTQVANAANDWLRQGKSIVETEELITDSVILSKLGKIESAEATKYLTSSLNGYKLAASDAIKIVDKLSAVDMESASDAGGIAESLSKTASAANMAGVSFDKLIGYIATVKEVTQDSDESVGNAFKSIFSRMNQIKAGKFVDAETGEALNDVEKVLNSVGIAMRDANNEFISSEKVLDEVGTKWSTFDSTTQRAISTAVAGTYQYNKAISLFDNYGNALKYAEVSANSAGTAIDKFNKSYKESLEAKTNTLQASFESLVMNSDLTEVTSEILDATNALVTFIDKTGLLNTTLKGLAVAGAVKMFSVIKTEVLNISSVLTKFQSALSIVAQSNISAREYERLLMLTNGLSTSQMKLVLSTDALSAAQKKQLLVGSGLTAEEAELQLQTWGMTAANTGLAVSAGVAGNAMKGLGNSIKALFLADPITTTFLIITTVVAGAVKLYDALTVSVKEANDAMDNAVSSYESAKSELESLNSELESNQKLIDELTAKGGNITYAEKGQLEELKEITKQLEIQRDIAERNAADAAKEAGEKTVDAYNKQYGDYDVSQERVDELLDYTKYSGNGLIAMDENDISANIAELINLKSLLEDTENQLSDTEGMADDKIRLLESDFQSYVDAISDVEGNLDVVLNDLTEKQNNLKDQYDIAIEKQTNNENLTSSDKEAIATYEKISSQIEFIYSYLDPNKWKSMKISDIFDTDGIEKTKDELIEMAKSSKITPETIAPYKNLDEAIKNSGLSAQEFCNEINACVDGIDNLQNVDVPSLTPISFEEAWENLKTTDEDELKDLRKNLLELAESGQLTKNAFEEQMGSDTFLKQIGMDAEDAVEKINSFVTATDQLNSMDSQISKISDALATKKDSKSVDISALSSFSADVKGLESWEEFERLLGSTTSSMAECQAAANALATEYVNSNNFLANLNDTNRDYYVTVLDNMGVENAEEVVTSALAEKNRQLAIAKEYAAKTGKELAEVSSEEILKLFELGKETDDTTQDMIAYWMQKNNANNITLMTNGDIQNLSSLVTALGGSTKALQKYAYFKKLAMSDAQIKMGLGDYWNEQADKYFTDAQKEVDSALSNKETNISTKVKPTGSDAYKNKSSSKKQSQKTEIDWVARKLTVLQKIIDATKTKFKNLFDIDSKKNNLNTQIRQTSKLIASELKAVSVYQKKADGIKLPGTLKNKVLNGTYDITKYDSKTADRINEFQGYIDKVSECKNAVESLKTELRSLKEEKLQLSVDEADSNLSRLQAKFESLYTLKDKNSNLKEQIKWARQSYNYQIKIAELNGDTIKAETLRNQKKNDILDIREQRLQIYADKYKAKYDLYKQYEDNATSAAKKNRYEEKALSVLEKQYSKLIQIANLRNDTVEASRLQAEYEASIAESYKTQFDNIQNGYDKTVSLLQHQADNSQNKINIAQAKGEISDPKNYLKQIEVNNKEIGQRVKERDELIKALEKIPKSTDQWYDAVENIYAVDKAINDLKQSNIDLQKAINQIQFNVFDKFQDKLSDIIDESEFLISLLNEDKLFDDNGKITNDGLTAMGQYTVNYDVAMSQSQYYKQAVDDLNASLKAGTITQGEYDENISKYVSGQREAIKSAESYKKAVISLVKDGLDKQNSALKESVEKQKELLDAQKDLKSFSDLIKDKTKTIADLQKQINALQGDDSEENRKKLQQLKSQLANAQKDYEDTMYDRSISDQKDALDKMYDDSVKATEEYLKDTDKVFTDSLALVNANTTNIATNLQAVSKKVGYDISTEITDAWKKSGQAVSDFNQTFTNNSVTMIANISAIAGQFREMAEAAKAAAIEAAKAVESTANVSANEQVYENIGSNSVIAPPSTGSNNKTATLSEVKSFINAKKVVSKYAYGEHSDLIKYIWDKLDNKKSTPKDSDKGGYSLRNEDIIELGRMLGVEVKGEKTTASERTRILERLKKVGFKNGGLIEGDENPMLKQLTGGDGLITIAKPGEYVLTEKELDKLRQSMNLIPHNVEKMTSGNDTNNMKRMNVQPVYNIDNSINVEGIATNEVLKQAEETSKRQIESAFRQVNQGVYARGGRW